MLGTLYKLILSTRFLSAAGEDGEYPLVVIAYHDIVASDDYLSWLRVDVANFEKQIMMLREIGSFIRPDDLFVPERLEKNRPNFLLTFDDGFHGNYLHVVPLLRKYGVPALFFISTCNMGTGEPFWFDRVILPIQYRKLRSVDLSDMGLASYKFATTGKTVRWDGIQILLDDIKRMSARRGNGFVDDVILRLESAAGLPAGGEGVNHSRPLSRELIEEMHKSGLCRFGSHSHRHEILTSLLDEELGRELSLSRKILEDLLGVDVEHFCYPNGNSDQRVRLACRNAGYRYGFTTRTGRVNRKTDPMQIPRLLVGGYDSTAWLVWKLVKILCSNSSDNH